MAENGLTVTISGAALSLLFYENVRNAGDQMGFLLGEVLKYVTQNETDTENQVESVKTHVDVQSILPCSPTDVMHDSNGKIQVKKMKQFVSDKSKRVVGWFRFRRNFSLVPSLRDKIIHQQFAELFPAGENFVACIMNSSSSDKKGTHKFRHVFLNYQFGQYHPIPLRIHNLGDDVSRHDGSDYKIAPQKLHPKDPDVFTKFVSQLNLNLSQTPGLVSAGIIQSAAERRLESLVHLVCRSDREVLELERQVFAMREKIINEVNDERPSKSSISSPSEKNCLPRQKSNDETKFLRNKQSTPNNFGNFDNSRKNDQPTITKKRDSGSSFSPHVSTNSAQSQTGTNKRRNAAKRNLHAGSSPNC